MIKIANNLRNLRVKASATNALATDLPFNLHSVGGQPSHYSYGNTPATSMDPKLVGQYAQGLLPRVLSPENFAALINTMHGADRRGTSLRARFGRPRPFVPPRGPALREPVSNDYRNSMSQLYDRARLNPITSDKTREMLDLMGRRKASAANPVATNLPFNRHSGEGPSYYSYGNTPATSMLPEVMEQYDDGDFGTMSPEDFAAYNNTAYDVKLRRPRGPAQGIRNFRNAETGVASQVWRPSMSQEYDRALRRSLGEKNIPTTNPYKPYAR